MILLFDSWIYPLVFHTSGNPMVISWTEGKTSQHSPGNFLRTRLSGSPWTKSAPKEITRRVVSRPGLYVDTTDTTRKKKEKKTDWQISLNLVWVGRINWPHVANDDPTWFALTLTHMRSFTCCTTTTTTLPTKIRKTEKMVVSCCFYSISSH